METVSTSAYIGLMKMLSLQSHVTLGASILATE
jgi:hypothetical protein